MIIRAKLKVKKFDKDLKVLGAVEVFQDVRVSDKLKRGKKVAKAVYSELGKLPWKHIILQVIDLKDVSNTVNNVTKDYNYTPKYYAPRQGNKA